MQKKIKQFSLALLICLLFMAAAISTLGLRDQVVAADLVVVPGNTVNPDGKPSDRLRGRLNAALRLYVAQKCKAILVSGGTGEEGHDVAIVMKKYLVDHGVPDAAVYTDSQGINTFATAKAATSLMREKNWKSSMLASQFFHIARFQLAMKKYGVDPVGHVHSTDYEIRDAYSLGREVFAYFEYTFSNPQAE
ncbi:ElyC/SanA/YdcF family protein [Undibacterium sp. Di27W]|uniref:ElyC/SanA/YdcF family protein n=1 Tax=Undibacterium sp. Di27W TaxID=3413036 RepID=UPI003BF6195B